MSKKQMNDRQKETLRQILEIIDKVYETAKNRQWQDMGNSLQAIGTMKEPLAEFLEHAHAAQMLENIQATLDDMERSLQCGDEERMEMKLEFQLLPFLRILKESFYFWCSVFPDEEKQAAYYREEFAAHYRNPYMKADKPAPCRLSIVIPAYNHLDMTKRCVEQLLKETDIDALDAELILIDHGSGDETLEYFEGLGIGKVIHFKYNVRMYMFGLMAQICRGEYFAYVSNDVLVTRNWAQLLMACLDSDESIIAAVPSTPNTVNYQEPEGASDDPAEFIDWANETNAIDPLRYDDRARLMPPLGMYRTAAVSKIGFADPMLYTMEFWDDDFSLRARRGGYRQVLCRGVSCYHFGSVTGGHEQAQTLLRGRNLFAEKHGVDAWGLGSYYLHSAMKFIMKHMPNKEKLAALGLDCGFGDMMLQMRNELRRQGRKCEIYNLTCDWRYVPDLEPLSDGFAYCDSLAEGLNDGFHGSLFDCIYLNRDIAEYTDYEELFRAASSRLADGGIFMFLTKNPFFAKTLYSLFCLSFPEGMEQLHFIDLNKLMDKAKQYFSSIEIGEAKESNFGTAELFIKGLYGGSKNLDNILKTTSTAEYRVVCRK